MDGLRSTWPRLVSFTAALALVLSHGLSAGSTATAVTPPILATVSEGDLLRLVRLDPRTLERLAGPTITVGRRLPNQEGSLVWARSQSSGRLAIVEHPRQERLFVLDPPRMRVLRTLGPQPGGLVFTHVAWAPRGKLLAAGIRSGRRRFMTFPRTGPAVSVGVEGYSSIAAGTRFLFPGSTTLGSAKVGVAFVGAGLRSVLLRRIKSAPETTPAMESELTPAARAALDHVRRQVEFEWDVPFADVKMESVVARGWGDASMGCPKPGLGYIQPLTAGHQVVVTARGRYYDYRVALWSQYPAFCRFWTEPLDVGATAR